ncbi:V4R domain-containing protein [Methanothermococcus sp.]|uniref:V4R domain-containing protein n=1 Tax=Methanothermococcus sp. TaxID=2614238 RepID=UPI0025CF0A9F|nr:V4R domain-containing protein [Methanothermococcus sp.]
MKKSDVLELSFEEMYNVDRPTLGRKADVSLIRALKLSIIEYLGFNAASKLYFAGMHFGENIGVKSIDDMKEFFKELGIGILSMASENPLKLRVEECIDCAGLPNLGKPICYFEAGVIAGCLESILDKKVKVVETKCYANGDDCCEFEVSILNTKE